MNHYGEQALRYWRQYLPGSYGRAEDPEEFFTRLGEQADAEIGDRYLEYAGLDVAAESAEHKQARLTQAMNRAAEEVFAELVTPSPPSQGEPGPETPLGSYVPATTFRPESPALHGVQERIDRGRTPGGA